mgnify:FL=1
MTSLARSIRPQVAWPAALELSRTHVDTALLFLNSSYSSVPPKGGEVQGQRSNLSTSCPSQSAERRSGACGRLAQRV